ncbi:hypothetical protein [Terribacillus saccharophilus]|nr:hypothetical protein [Terribacillus saccharophilus]
MRTHSSRGEIPIVTGAASGTGYATSEQLLKNGQRKHFFNTIHN